METIGNKIVRLRKEKGLSQADLAKAINVSPSTLCRWEKNQRTPSPEDIDAMTDVFGIPKEAFVFGSNVSDPKSEAENPKSLEHTLTDKYSKKTKAVVLICALASLILVFTVLILFINRKKQYSLLDESIIINSYGETEVDRHYLLPKNFSDSDIDGFISKTAALVFEDPQYDGCEAIGFIFYETREKYKQGDSYITSVFLR